MRSDPTNPETTREQERETEEHDLHERSPRGEDEAGTPATPATERDDDKAAPPGIHT
jgi:hypothetical protein